jgi:hypothetical protein
MIFMQGIKLDGNFTHTIWSSPTHDASACEDKIAPVVILFAHRK